MLWYHFDDFYFFSSLLNQQLSWKYKHFTDMGLILASSGIPGFSCLQERNLGSWVCGNHVSSSSASVFMVSLLFKCPNCRELSLLSLLSFPCLLLASGAYFSGNTWVWLMELICINFKKTNNQGFNFLYSWLYIFL